MKHMLLTAVANFMKNIINKLRLIEQETSTEKGEYNLFALFLREDSPNKWDILVSAGWIENKEDALNYLATKIQNAFNQDELLLISRIVLIDDNNPYLPELQQEINTGQSVAEIKDTTLFGLQIKHGFLITSRRRQAA